MVRWQYTTVNIGTKGASFRIGEALAYFGERGWELAAVLDRPDVELGDGFVIFKRPVAEGEEPDGPWSQLWNALQVDAAYQEARGDN